MNPHDALFKVTFGHAPTTAAWLAQAFPELDLPWDTLRPVPTEAIDTDLGVRIGDVVFRVGLDDDAAWVLLLLEHQSVSDARMPLRLLSWMVRHWESSTLPLPPVVPIVVANVGGGWRGPTRLGALLASGPSDAVDWAHALSFRLVDLVADPSSVQLGPPGARLCLHALRRARTGGTWRMLAEQIGDFEAATQALGLPWSEAVLSYAFHVEAAMPDPAIRDTLTRTVPDAEPVFRSLADKLREEGRELALREVVRTVLRARGLLDADAEARLGRLNGDDLMAWHNALFPAQR